MDKRAVAGTGEIRRRRECLKCHQRFSTYEKLAKLEIMVIKRDGRKQIFDKLKLQMGISKALEKRPALDQVEIIADRIEAKMRKEGLKEVTSKVIGRTVLGELKKLDKVAYLRFASVYRQFNKPSDFAKELTSLS